jgi:hypothetical protein
MVTSKSETIFITPIESWYCILSNAQTPLIFSLANSYLSLQENIIITNKQNSIIFFILILFVYDIYMFIILIHNFVCAYINISLINIYFINKHFIKDYESNNLIKLMFYCLFARNIL